MSEASVDIVRASRDGHQFHEAWVARRALGLLLPKDDLCGIAVEGLSDDIEEDASPAIIEIADATLYFGQSATYEDASRIEVAQFKYSVAKAETGIRAFDLKKTLEKFGDAEKDFIKKYGEAGTWDRFRYTFITNRPISEDLKSALAGFADPTALTGEPKEQYNQLLQAVNLSPAHCAKFLPRLSIQARTAKLGEIEGANAAIIANWSASNDALARARLGDLRKLVRDKAGSAGQTNKLIVKVDILAALGVADEEQLLPARDAFPNVGDVVERVQLAEFVKEVGSSGCWVLHATGGVGKTVFIQSAAKKLADTDEVVLFDCFGGGAYRSPTDGRHRPERGLLHIVNELACRGLCDPILPESSDPSEVIRRSLQRFEQSLVTLRRTRPAARLIIIMDAADNSAIEAANRGQPSFPRDLLESLSHRTEAIEGLVLLATARTERREKAIGNASCQQFELRPFTPSEIEKFVHARRPEATSAQISVLSVRSEGNPRVLANLIAPDRSLQGETETDTKVALPSLIEERIERAIRQADQSGAQKDAIATFLCALSVLPPPVPVKEIATAFGLSEAEAESLAADLSPLLERTRYGLIFRDEPTETLVSEKYGAKLDLLTNVVVRLNAAQSTSVYAARALPGLLFAMGQVETLRQLAFDQRFPSELSSDVAKRGIRLNRLKTALSAAAKAADFNTAVDVLVELSSIALADERGETYLLNNADLAVTLGDTETLRRLFEVRTSWPGTRHARLAIAYTTEGTQGDAHNHVVRADEWLRWVEQNAENREFRDRIHPQIDDRVSIPFYLVRARRFVDAARFLARWYGWYGYQLSVRMLELARVSHSAGAFAQLSDLAETLGRCRHPPASLIAATFYVFPELSADVSRKLLRRVVSVAKNTDQIGDDFEMRGEQNSYRMALIRCALRAAHLGLGKEAIAIIEHASPRRYQFYSLHHPWSAHYIVPWALSVAARAAAENREPTLFECLPSELYGLINDETCPAAETDQISLLLKKLDEKKTKSKGEDKPKDRTLSPSDLEDAPRRIRSEVKSVLQLVRDLVAIVTARDEREVETRINAFFDAWANYQNAPKERSYDFNTKKQFLDDLYSSTGTAILTALGQVNSHSAARFATCAESSNAYPIAWRLQFISQLANQATGKITAGRLAVEAVNSIQNEDDVTGRAALFAQLARAILPADENEARAIFHRGLTELDAIGSGDYGFTNELLAFSTSIRSGPLSSISALRVAKVCELNNYDSRKFPWALTGQAFSRIWGLRYLAQIGRWHDRDKVDLELTLPPALCFLVRDRLLSPESAVGMLGLVDLVEMWDWGWKDLCQSLIDVGASVALFSDVLRAYERAHPSGNYYRLDEVRAVLESSPQVFASVRSKLDDLRDRASHRRTVDRNTPPLAGQPDMHREKPDKRATITMKVEHTDPLDPASLEALLDTISELDGALELKQFAFERLRARVSYGDRGRHIEALLGARNAELFTKNALLEDTKRDWKPDSPSGLDSLAAGGRLIQDHAAELLGKSWGFNWELNKLAEVSGRPRWELAMKLVEAATTRDIDAASTTWLNLGTLLSEKADPAVAKKALERLMDSGTARLADNVGDGAWRGELDPGENELRTVAGLVWLCLGAPEAAMRWRAAHAVRELARLGKWEVITHLFACSKDSDAGPFQDRSLPFFVLHARLWLLIAIGRVALDFPEQVAQFTNELQAIALNDGFPHVGMREAAKRALLAITKGKRDRNARQLARSLAGINASQFQLVGDPSKHSAARYSKRPNDIPEPTPDFGFEYDFEKYQPGRLGRLFGMPDWQIRDQLVTCIRGWDQNVKSMYDFAGRPKRGDTRNYNLGTADEYHNYGTYLAWHALAIVGGQLLLTTPLQKAHEWEDPWEDFVARFSITRKDGLWLADGTSLYPSFAQHDLIAGNGNKDTPAHDSTLLLSLAGIGANLSVDDRLIVAGSWSSPDNVSVSIMSALVPEGDSDLAARSLTTSSEFHMWLPDHHPDDRLGDEYAPLEPWTFNREAECKLDEDDPLGSRSALARHCPAGRTIKERRLRATGAWQTAWNEPTGRHAFQSLAWGRHTGHGRRADREQGDALYCDAQFMRELLAAKAQRLVLLVKLQHYREKKYDEHGTGGTFTHSWIIAVVDEALGVATYSKNAADDAAISKLEQHARFSFRERYRALSEQH
ncbi:MULTISPECIES: hypothetical protein [unclassified Bradyrhizobium]|uniref:hypothetical protein n=1 Tax=unclassified Bradyrhizobium TaxID=2631580 RepID=UPI002915DF45|nr:MULTISPECIES: hypothetical protein [unclassified Bradyrhizobium]